MEKLIVGCIEVLLALAFWVVIALGASWVLMWAWNLLVPALFHGPSITYDMACAIYCAITLIGTAFKMTITASKD